MTDLGVLSDAACVARAQRGDAAAFDVLVRRHFRMAYALALAATANPFDADDVCQDAFVRAAAHLGECRDGGKFAAWLARIVRNQAANLRERERVRSAVPLDEAMAMAPGGAGQRVEREELRAQLAAALLRLSPVQREVVLLHDLDGWKHRAIAELLGVSEVMSRQHLFVARRSLREQLGPYAFGERVHE